MADNELAIDIIAIDSISNILERIGEHFGVLGQIAASALAAAGTAFEKLLDAGMDAADTQARFNSLVDASPLKGFKGQMELMADAWSKSTRFQADNILAAEGQLSVYTNIGKNVFPDALKATINLAEYMKTDASSAAVYMGKALEDISGGSLTLLGRQRLLTKEQIETAKGMALMGDQAGAQAYVIGILNGKIGTLAEDLAKAGSGPGKVFSNSIREMTEKLGGPLVDAFNRVFPYLTSLAESIFPTISFLITSYVAPALSGLVDIFGRLSGALQGGGAGGFVAQLGHEIGNLAVGFSNFMTQIDWKKVTQDIIKGFSKIDWKQLVHDISTAARDVAVGLAYAISNVDWGALSHNLAVGIAGINWDEAGKNFGQGANALFEALLAAAKEVHWGEIANVAAGAIFDSWGAAITQFDWIQPILDFVVGNLGGLQKTPKKGSSSNPGADLWNQLHGGNAMHAKAAGGPVSAGEMYWVGENGPEPFIPATNGTILPNSALTGAGSVTLNVRVSGAYDPQQAARDMKPALRYALRELGVAVNG